MRSNTMYLHKQKFLNTAYMYVISVTAMARLKITC